MSANPQSDLFEQGTFQKLAAPAARARRTDPRPSHVAAYQVEREGKAGAQRGFALAAVRLRPGSTSQELAEAAGQCRYMLARRLPELREKKLVRSGEDRACQVTGRLAQTWWPL